MGLKELKGRHLLWLADYSREEIEHFIYLGLELKRRFYGGERVIPLLEGRTIGLIFEKPSTRTRVSFQVAARQLGAESIYMGWGELQLGRGESIADTARVLSRYLDAVVLRVRRHESLVEFARHSDIPVINGLSDLVHPVQALGDMMTILEKLGRLRGVKLVFVGDGSDNVLHSLLLAGSKLGLHIVVSSPRELRPREAILEIALREAEESGATIEFVEDPRVAVEGADVVYTDVWVSMGQEAEREYRVKLLSGYRVDEKLMERAGNRAVFMHCLPAFRGEEVTDGVIDGPRSIVWDQAENRLHIQKSILALLVR